MGDINIDALDSNHICTKRWVDMLKSFGLKLLIQTPTRVMASTLSVIDNVISNIPAVTVSVLNTVISDHFGQEPVIIGEQLTRESNIFFNI